MAKLLNEYDAEIFGETVECVDIGNIMKELSTLRDEYIDNRDKLDVVSTVEDIIIDNCYEEM